MGIKELWTILEPFSERRPLYQLEGKTVAIDLSGWICDSQNIVEYYVQPHMFIRNLFFRTCCLLMIGAVPVFVLEGKAPSMKSNTMSKRNEIQFRGAKPRNIETNKEKSQKKTGNRSRFNAVQKQCEKLLNALGLKCVSGPGEAEAFCAYLNELKYVDGIISQDSDCFGYGATRVYRNFCISQQNTQGGSVDVYDLKKIQEVKKIGRNHIICLALLCGCDYCPEGVGGVGRDAALKLIEVYDDDKILDRMRSWRDNDEFGILEAKVADKRICNQCGHLGNLRKHLKSGCSSCSTFLGCNVTEYREKNMLLKNELSIRKKAIVNPKFPDEEIINEFLTKPSDKPHLNLSWSMPVLHEFVSIMSNVLEWEEIYSFQKFLPLLTRWHLKTESSNCTLKPKVIHKRRKVKGTASFEIIWEDVKGIYNGLIPEDQFLNYIEVNKGLSPWVTVEPEELVKNKYPELVTAFNEATNLKNVKKKSKKPTAVKATKGEKRTRVDKINNAQGSSIKQFFKVQKKVHTKSYTPETKSNLSGLLSQIACEDDEELNLSDVVEDIISRPGILSKPIELEYEIKDTKLEAQHNDSSNFFFDQNILHDEFEKTFDNLTKVYAA